MSDAARFILPALSHAIVRVGSVNAPRPPRPSRSSWFPLSRSRPEGGRAGPARASGPCTQAGSPAGGPRAKRVAGARPSRPLRIAALSSVRGRQQGSSERSVFEKPRHLCRRCGSTLVWGR